MDIVLLGRVILVSIAIPLLVMMVNLALGSLNERKLNSKRFVNCVDIKLSKKLRHRRLVYGFEKRTTLLDRIMNNIVN